MQYLITLAIFELWIIYQNFWHLVNQRVILNCTFANRMYTHSIKMCLLNKSIKNLLPTIIKWSPKTFSALKLLVQSFQENEIFVLKNICYSNQIRYSDLKMYSESHKYISSSWELSKMWTWVCMSNHVSQFTCLLYTCK